MERSDESQKDVEGEKLFQLAHVDQRRAQSEIIRELYNRLNSGAFISFAQNYEDILLQRLFAKQKFGFFVDVGAFHPTFKSVTRLLYDQGWRGINIDLCKVNISRFLKDRPRDINLCCAVGSGEIKRQNFFIQSGTTRSTADGALADRYKSRGLAISEETLDVFSLTEILDSHAKNHVDVLSIDVEGYEKEVLSGINLEKYRPSIILIEATYPETSQPNWDGWESILTNAGYEFMYFDGLNRFYADRPSDSTRRAFEAPPNFFDNFIRHETVLAALALRSD